MRDVCICLCLLLALIVGTALNAHYVKKQVYHFTRAAEQLQKEEDLSITLNNIENTWQKNRPWLRITVSDQELDHLDEALTNLRWAYTAGEKKEFQRYRLLFLDAVKEISQREHLPLKIFAPK